jgi:hypothetical protein
MEDAKYVEDIKNNNLNLQQKNKLLWSISIQIIPM